VRWPSHWQHPFFEHFRKHLLYDSTFVNIPEDYNGLFMAFMAHFHGMQLSKGCQGCIGH
jgi:hypothetical protein